MLPLTITKSKNRTSHTINSLEGILRANLPLLGFCFNSSFILGKGTIGCLSNPCLSSLSPFGNSGNMERVITMRIEYYACYQLLLPYSELLNISLAPFS
jgi:hypothetical protein